MGNEKLNKLLIGFVFLVVCFALDRLSKIYILNILNNEGQVDLYINQFLNIYLVWNTGIGFGLFSSENDFYYNLFTGIIIAINFVILYFAYIEDKFIMVGLFDFKISFFNFWIISITEIKFTCSSLFQIL